jgi:putative nucleotidyltransferase with HDIG domain
MSEPLTREQAWDLVTEWTAGESLRRHVLAVEACMRAYAARLGGDAEEWGLVGLLHDLDYERFPDPETGHPRMGMEELSRRGFSDAFVRAVASHADYLGVPRETPMEKALYAVDELSGFVMACAYVRPEGIHGMTPKSVRKKLKTPAFAAAVSREDLRRGAEDLGVDFDEHVATVIAALAERADELGLGGRREAAA